MVLRVCTLAKTFRPTHKSVIMIRYANNIEIPMATVIIMVTVTIIMVMGTATMEAEVVVEEVEVGGTEGAEGAEGEDVEEEVVVAAKITVPPVTFFSQAQSSMMDSATLCCNFWVGAGIFQFGMYAECRWPGVLGIYQEFALRVSLCIVTLL